MWMWNSDTADCAMKLPIGKSCRVNEKQCPMYNMNKDNDGTNQQD